MRNASRLVGLLGALVASGCNGTRPDERNLDVVLFEQRAALERDLSLGATGDDVRALQDYLTRYGYFPNAALATAYPAWLPVGATAGPESGVYDEPTRIAVRAFQGRAGVPQSGIVDLATRQLVAAPRCGVPEGTSERDRGSRFPLHGSTWSKTTLSWSIANLPSGLDAGELTREIGAAFAAFHAETNLEFVPVAGAGDIEINFDRIDGPGGSIARTAFPETGGDMTLDSAELWSTAETTAPDRLDLRTVVLHQLGHALGMVHAVSNVTVMYPYARAGEQRRELAVDDRVAISAVYDSWSEAPGGVAHDVGVGANGDVWAVLSIPGASGRAAARRTESNWQRVSGDFSALRITVAPEGTPWVCDENGNIWQNLGGGDARAWTQRPGCCRDLGAGADGSVWGVGCPTVAHGGRIYKWNGTDWNEATGGLGGTRIAVGPTGVPWVVDAQGTIYRRTSADWSSGSWEVVSGVANDIGIGPEGAVWGVGAIATLGGFKLYLWNDSLADASRVASGSWITVTGGATNMAVGPVGPWVVNSWGGVWRQTATKPPYQ